MEAVSAIAKFPALKKLGKNATSKNVPEGAKPMIDRLVTGRIVSGLKLDAMGAEAKSVSLAKASAEMAKLARSKTSG